MPYPTDSETLSRDWAAERTNYPGDMAEMALAHAIGDKFEAAYRRGICSTSVER